MAMLHPDPPRISGSKHREDRHPRTFSRVRHSISNKVHSNSSNKVHSNSSVKVHRSNISKVRHSHINTVRHNHISKLRHSSINKASHNSINRACHREATHHRRAILPSNSSSSLDGASNNSSSLDGVNNSRPLLPHILRQDMILERKPRVTAVGTLMISEQR
jgi:hypothetical protein